MKLVNGEGWSYISLHGEAGYESRTAHYFKNQVAICGKDLHFNGPYLDEADYCCEKCIKEIKNKGDKNEK